MLSIKLESTVANVAASGCLLQLGSVASNAVLCICVGWQAESSATARPVPHLLARACDQWS